MPPPHIAQWLNQALSTYVYKDQAFQAAGAALDTYPSLKVKTDQYTFDDGRTLLLLCIHGTLPIVYSSARYNVPLNIWFPLDYPKSPPLVYVVPTSGMMVRKGRGVALDGKVEEEQGSYLDGWRRKPEAHSILPLLQSLVDSFSIQPPVYAKPKTSVTSQPPSNGPPPPSSPQASTSSPVRHNTAPQPSYQPSSESLPTYSRPPQPQPPPPPPPPSGSPSPHPSQHQQQHARQPSYSAGPPAPPLPPNARGSSLPPQSPPRSAPQSPSAMYRPPPWGGGPPPPNQSWSSLAPGQQQQQQHPGQWGSPPPPQGPPSSFHQQSYRPPPSPPTGPQSPPPPSHQLQQQQPPQPQYLQQQQQQQRPPPPNGSYHSPQNSYSQPQSQPPYIPQQQQQHQQPYRPPPPPQQQSPPPAPTPRQPIPDLMDSIDAPFSSSSSPTQQQPGGLAPPPPPPNPELLLLHSTLQTRLSSTLASHLSSLSTRQHQLLQIREDLARAPAAIEDEMGRLKAVRDVCLGVAERVGGVVREGEERVGKVGGMGEGGREEVSVDEVVCSTTIVYNQLIDLVAEDAAISDTLYQLNRALHNEKIDLERFLKATRILAREQFMKRALIERIVKG